MISLPPPSLQRTIQRLVVSFAPERIILFGSYAKGTNHAGSDVDLLVVANLNGHRDVHHRRARQLVAGCFPPVDVILCSPEEAVQASATPSPFLLSILSTGSTVYIRL